MIEIDEFPFTCEFYQMRIADKDNPLSKPEKVVTYNGSCDIQITTKEIGMLAVESEYAVFIPIIPTVLTDAKGVEYMQIDKGYNFEGLQYGRKIKGSVVNVQPSQLGKSVVYINSVKS